MKVFGRWIKCIFRPGYKRTRYRMVLWSFAAISLLQLLSFHQATILTSNPNPEFALEFIDLCKTLSYVLASVVASYLSLESFWPSEKRPHQNNYGLYRPRKKQDEEPATGNDPTDLEVD